MRGGGDNAVIAVASADVRPLWGVDEVSAYLGVPVETLYAWRKRKYGPPAARLGRHLRYDPDAVRAWFLGQAV